ncbi:hypothetical protein VD659_09250 [Herbiconiux sp. 11R-BC]|uniref:IS1096 element passenger TnpR family protein n=1 Tax=Herbiconiux sp. 11R-BC TaxID=3111637 RepID=UPI003C008B67
MGARDKKPGRMHGAGPAAGSGSGAAVTATLLAFERWYTRHAAEGGHAHPPAAEVSALLKRLFALSAGRLRQPAVPVLESLLGAVEAEPELAARLPEVIETLEHYLDFAVDTGAWQAGDAQIDASAEFLEVAYEVSTGLLLFLIDALDDVADVPPAQERAALGALAAPLRSADQLIVRLRGLLDDADPLSVPGALTLERVLGVLSVAASPGLLPGASTEEIVRMLDTAAGVSPEEAAAADAPTARMLATLEREGLVATPAGASGVRPVAAPALRAALADAVITIADELGLLDDENPHPSGTALEVQVSTVGSEPASWRRLLLAADSDLGGLHLAIQLAFDWENDERHEFTSATDPEVVFTAIDPLDEAPDDESVADENEVEIGELLVEPGDEVTYVYGDDQPRRLVVRLDAVQDPSETSAGAAASASPSPVLPRCTGASAGLDVAEIDRQLAPLRLR